MARLISIIIILAVFLAFIVLNMNNRCDISFGVKTFQDIPVFISVLFSFLLGMLFALPFGFSLSRKLKKKSKEELPETVRKKRWGKDKNKGSAHDTPTVVEEINKDSSPYGID